MAIAKVNTTPRTRILEAILASDTQTPFVSPTQLADGLTAMFNEILAASGKTLKREWVSKEVLKRTYNLTDHYCKRIINENNVPFRTTQTGSVRYSVSAFEKAYQYACT